MQGKCDFPASSQGPRPVPTVGSARHTAPAASTSQSTVYVSVGSAQSLGLDKGGASRHTSVGSAQRRDENERQSVPPTTPREGRDSTDSQVLVYQPGGPRSTVPRNRLDGRNSINPTDVRDPAGGSTHPPGHTDKQFPTDPIPQDGRNPSEPQDGMTKIPWLRAPRVAEIPGIARPRVSQTRLAYTMACFPSAALAFSLAVPTAASASGNRPTEPRKPTDVTRRLCPGLPRKKLKVIRPSFASADSQVLVNPPGGPRSAVPRNHLDGRNSFNPTDERDPAGGRYSNPRPDTGSVPTGGRDSTHPSGHTDKQIPTDPIPQDGRNPSEPQYGMGFRDPRATSPQGGRNPGDSQAAGFIDPPGLYTGLFSGRDPGFFPGRSHGHKRLGKSAHGPPQAKRRNPALPGATQEETELSRPSFASPPGGTYDGFFPGFSRAHTAQGRARTASIQGFLTPQPRISLGPGRLPRRPWEHLLARSPWVYRRFIQWMSGRILNNDPEPRS